MSAIDDFLDGGLEGAEQHAQNRWGPRVQAVEVYGHQLAPPFSDRYDETHETDGPDQDECTLHSYSHKFDADVIAYYEVTIRFGPRFFTRLIRIRGRVKGIEYSGTHMSYPWKKNYLASVPPDERHEYVLKLNDKVIWQGDRYPSVEVSVGGEVTPDLDDEVTRFVFRHIMDSDQTKEA